MSAALDRHQRVQALKGLLDRRFPGTTVLDQPQYGAVPSGLPLDELLPGGLPRGATTLFSGGPACGKTGAALAYAAGWTGEGGTLAWLHAGSFSACSAAHARVDLNRLLHVQTSTRAQTLRCLDSLLRWQAFGLVVVDWVGRSGRGADWNRLLRLVTGSRTALLVLATPRPDGDPLRYGAAVHVRFARRSGRRGGGAPVTDAELLRSRYRRGGGRVRLLGHGLACAPFALLPDLPGLGQALHDEP